MAELLNKKEVIKINGQVIRPADVNFVLIGFEGDEASFRKIPRQRVTLHGLKVSHDVEVDHLRNELNEVFWPKMWDELLPPPFRYHIFVKVPREIEPDWEERADYFGQTVIGCFNVPKELDAQQLYFWLQKGLDDEDVLLEAALQNLKTAERKLKKTETAIESIPYMNVRGRTEEQRAARRVQMAQSLGREKQDREDKVAMCKRHVTAERIRRATEVFTLKLDDAPKASDMESEEVKAAMDDALRRRNAADMQELEQDLKDRKAHDGNTWFVQLPERIEFLGRILVHKTDWLEYRLSIHPETGRLWAGKGDMPPEFWKGEINMRGVVVARRQHGQGTMRFPDRARGIYLGQWLKGEQHGRGIQLTEAGRYDGTFLGSLRLGRGLMAFANGDRYSGDFKSDKVRNVGSLLNGDEYMDGGPSNFGVFEFADGATYEGRWRSGRPNGKGTYTTKDGDVYAGEWKDGVMHGPGAVSMVDGTMRDGLFREGELFRDSHIRQPGLFSYKGNTEHDKPDGRGLMVMPNGDRYAGYFKDGLRQGRGTLLYKDVKMLYNKLSLKTRYTGRRMYEGLWRAGDIRARNVHTDLDGDSPFFTTNNRSERFPELFVLNKSQTDEFYRRKKARKIKREEELAARLAREKTLWVTFNRDRQAGRKNLKWLAQQKELDMAQRIRRFNQQLRQMHLQALDDDASTVTGASRGRRSRAKSMAGSVASSHR